MSKTMRLIDSRTGQMECRYCGYTHWANIRPGSGGRYYRGSWQCERRTCNARAKSRQVTLEPPTFQRGCTLAQAQSSSVDDARAI